jgi:hypothetical protein
MLVSTGLPSRLAALTIARCRENFLAIVQPLLAGLHEYTGLTLNIIGARINDDTQDFKTMRYVVDCGAMGFALICDSVRTREWSGARTGRDGIPRDIRQRSRII